MPSAFSVASSDAVARSGTRCRAPSAPRYVGYDGSEIGSSDGPVFDEPGGVQGPLGEHPPEREKIVLQRRPRQRLQRGPLDVGLIHHRVLLLEVEHRGPHLGVVDAGLVFARVHQAFAREALLHLREREPLRLETQVLLRVAGGARVAAFGEGLQTVGAGGRARRPQANRARLMAGQLLLLGAGAPGPDLIDGEQRLRVEGARAAARRVDQEPAPQHRQRGRDPIELQIISFAGGQRLAVAVAAIGGQPDEHRSVARAVENGRRPRVRQIDHGESARARRVGVDLPLQQLFGSFCATPAIWMARRSGGRSDNAGNASAAGSGCGRGRGAAGVTGADTAGATRDARRARATARGCSQTPSRSLRRSRTSHDRRVVEKLSLKTLSCVLYRP